MHFKRVGSKSTSRSPSNEMDMTSMVDVTFLLLIFFMVTASFTLQKSIAQPPASNAIHSQAPDDEFIEVVIDQANTYYVVTNDSEIEAPSEREMRSLVRDAKQNFGVSKLVITAHENSFHHKVVTAWDAGTSAGMNEITVRTTDLE